MQVQALQELLLLRRRPVHQVLRRSSPAAALRIGAAPGAARHYTSRAVELGVLGGQHSGLQLPQGQGPQGSAACRERMPQPQQAGQHLGRGLERGAGWRACAAAPKACSALASALQLVS